MYRGKPMNQINSSREMPGTQSPRVRVALVVTFVALLLWLSVALHLMFVGPEKKRLFRENRVQLPNLTIHFLDISTWLNNYWYVAVIPYVSVAAAIMAASYFLSERRSSVVVLLIWFSVLLVPPAVLHALIWFSWALPMMGVQN